MTSTPRRKCSDKASLLASCESEISDYGSFYSRDGLGYSELDDEKVGLLGQGHRSVSIAPSDPITLTWNNINVWVKTTAAVADDQGRKRRGPPCCPGGGGSQMKQILFGVNGVVEPGQLVALMGASGAGKTTLLNMLTFRNARSLHVEGDYRMNEVSAKRRIVTSYGAYIQQEEEFVGTMTVREHLIFHANLRLPSVYSMKKKIARVNEVIRELGLSKCQYMKIGVPNVIKGISGGEAKRLAFASAILTNPSVLFCDEPTSGLDSYMAENIVEILQGLAQQRKTVICTIHQPASEVYAMFDRIILLAEGRNAFFGSTADALTFFSRIERPCPSDFNPADHFIQTLAILPSAAEESRQKVDQICDAFESSEFSEEMLKKMQKKANTGSNLSLHAIDLEKRSPYSALWVVEFVFLFWRHVVNSYRNKTIVWFKMVQKIILGLFLGLLYLNSQSNQTGIMNVNGAMYFIMTEVAMPAIFGIIMMIPSAFPLLLREHHDGTYRMSSYYLAAMASYILQFSLDGLVFLTIAYFMVGFRNSASAFFVAAGIVIMLEQTSAAFGTMISSLSPVPQVAMVLAGPLMTLISLSGGLYVNAGMIPVYLSWFQYLSWFRYGFEALAINQWHYIDNIPCTVDDALNATVVTSACIQTGDEVLAMLSFDAANFGRDLLAIFGLYAGFHLIGFLVLTFRVKRNR